MSRHTFDWTEIERPSLAVIEAIAELTDRDIRELPPLQHSLDVEAFDALITRRQTNPGTDIQVSFRYEGYIITVEADGSIVVVLDQVGAD